jgi:D-mannonate dehydratase
LPGAEESYTVEDFLKVLQGYDGIDANRLKEKYYFLREIIPVTKLRFNGDSSRRSSLSHFRIA